MAASARVCAGRLEKEALSLFHQLHTRQPEGGGRYEVSPVFDAVPAVRHGFTTRLGGVSRGPWASLNLGFRRGDREQDVRENYRRVAGWLGVDPDKITATRQVHSVRVTRVGEEDAGRGVARPAGWETDALICDVPGVTLCAFGADCCILLLCDPAHHAVAAVHAGWRGTAGNIVGRAVAEMTRAFGTDPGQLLGVLGPSIGPCCFDTHADVPQALLSLGDGLAEPYVFPLPGGKFSVDLPGINGALLRRAGMREENLHQSRVCTCCHDDGVYWSHRRHGDSRGVQAGLIAWLGEEARP